MAATLINVFVVPKDRHDEFLETWRATAMHFRNTGSLIESHLHRNTDLGNDEFSFINIARWTSGQAWYDAHRAHRPAEYDIPGVVPHPSIFEVAVNVYSDVVSDGVVADHWIAEVPATSASIVPA